MRHLLTVLAGFVIVSAANAGSPPAATAPATQPARTMADYQAQAKKVRASLPKDFTVIIQPPFVVAGNGGTPAVKASAIGTIKWAVDHLKKDYFAQDPSDLITVYLFRDKASYDKYTKDFFQDNPGTPYGYYSEEHKALIMNIATGGGTLVHEIVHPFMAANFPACPSWFNEGLASLYEQSAEKDGHIVGRTNWRLAILQKGIKEKKLPTFKELFAMDAQTFYAEERGTNYAQSRYLLYYLQEKNLLHDYYKAFVKNQKQDPTGLETLKAVLKEQDLDAFQRRWETWVLRLRFPDN